MLDVSTRQARANFYASRDWRELRQKCLERDHYECQWCKAKGKVTDWSNATLEVDHIQELEFHPELALDIENLRTLCKDCHNKRHDRMNYRKSIKKPSKFHDDEWWG